ncbi:MAG TPA: F0F1 ATP synthase subunit A [Dehalococcoidia bacterium]|nr:F0F1 ATP synthase subunit A [Dehalococcoidia bacterium]
MRNPKVWIIVLFVLATIVVGFLLAGPQPEISLKAETVFAVGPFNVTNTVIAAYIVTAILVITSYFATRRAALVPSGFYNFVEALVEWMYSVVEEIAGPENGRKFFVVVATIFLFVVSSNYFGLLPIVNSIGVAHRGDHQETGFVWKDAGPIKVIVPHAAEVKEGEQTTSSHADDPNLGGFRPYLRSPNSDANSPLALAIWSAIFVELWGLQALGFRYLGKFFAFPPFARFSPINVFVGALEFLSELIRIISFTFRLFGNIFAGDVLITFISFLAPFVFPVIFYGLETFVGFIQAAVFALLTLVFAVMAVESHDEGEHEAHRTHGEPAEAAAH